ncbi:MAG: peptidoglycan DD-metalloendopeptidase family protein [Ectobacillus sp.]
MREGEKKQSSRKVVRLFQRRWVFPTIYIVCAAVILTAALWYQAANDKQNPKKPSAPYSQQETPTVPVANPSEIVKMPAVDADQVSVKKKFYEDKAPAQEQEQALVFYNNTYSANTGIDIAANDGKSFDVAAAVSGTVTKAEKDSLLGYVVTVDSGNGITTFYQSLEDVTVEVGDSVAQGEVIGKAGLSEVNKEAGYHVHFEIRKDNTPVNPEKYFNKSVADITVEQASNEKPPAKEEKPNADEKEPAKDGSEKENNNKQGEQ